MTFGQQLPAPLAISVEEHDSLISLLKVNNCGDKYIGGSFEDRRDKITKKTKLLRYNCAAEFDVVDFTYNKDVTKYLSFSNGPFCVPEFWVINVENGVDSLYASAGNFNSDCFMLTRKSNITDGFDNFYYRTLKSVIHKIDMNKSCVFLISGLFFKLFILSEGKVYVIDNGQLIPFNNYMKKKYTIKELKGKILHPKRSDYEAERKVLKL